MRTTLPKAGALDGRTIAADGAVATDGELGALVAFLASAGGECFSGCRCSLR